MGWGSNAKSSHTWSRWLYIPRHSKLWSPIWRSVCCLWRSFKQILPVVVKENRAQIVGISIQRSALWQFIQILKLTQNMRLNTADEWEHEFAQWQLDVGHGCHTDENGNLILPDHFHCTENTIESLMKPSILASHITFLQRTSTLLSVPFWPVTMTMSIPSTKIFSDNFQGNSRRFSVLIVSKTTIKKVARRFWCILWNI